MQKGRWWGQQGRGIEAERKDVEILRKRGGRRYRGWAHRKSGEKETDTD